MTDSQQTTGVEKLLLPTTGVAKTSWFTARGVSRAEVSSAVARGELVRIRRGWHRALSGADSYVVEAVEAGGLLSGIRALRCHGAWSPPDQRMPSLVVDHRARASGPSRSDGHAARANGCGVRYARSPNVHADDCADGLVPWPEAMRMMLLHEPLEYAIAALDALVRVGMARETRRMDPYTGLNETVYPLSPQAIRAQLEMISGGRRALRLIDPRAESGGETILRLRLRQLGISCEPQRRMADGRRRIDAWAGGCLPIEVDGRQHELLGQKLRDARKDIDLAQNGHPALRVTLAAILDAWPSVEAAVRMMIHRLTQ